MPWGEINRFQRNDGAIVQTFDDAKPSIPVPFASAQWGSLASFGATRYPGTKRYYGTSGNSFVAVVEFGAERARPRGHRGRRERRIPNRSTSTTRPQRYATGDLRAVYFYPDAAQGPHRAQLPPRRKATADRSSLCPEQARGSIS